MPMENNRNRRPQSPRIPTQSKSVMKRSRSNKEEENVSPFKLNSTTSPSAWALSPGRSLGFPLMPKGNSTSHQKTSGPVSTFFRYFRPNKPSSSLQTDDFHRFRILHNTLLHWRFANVRAHTSMANLPTLTKDRTFSVWVHNLRMRKRIVEKRIEVEKVKNEVRLYKIILPQISMLNKWAKLEKRNQESVGRLASLLSALSLRLPLLQGAKADVEAIQGAMSMANEVVAKIDAVITQCTSQKLEKVLYMLTERLSMCKEQEEWLEKLEKAVCLISALVVKESSVRLQLIQANKGNLNG